MVYKKILSMREAVGNRLIKIHLSSLGFELFMVYKKILSMREAVGNRLIKIHLASKMCEAPLLLLATPQIKHPIHVTHSYILALHAPS